MDTSFLIPTVVKLILDNYPEMRCCGSCPCSCDDMTRFICMGFSIDDINKYILNNSDKINECKKKFWEEL